VMTCLGTFGRRSVLAAAAVSAALLVNPAGAQGEVPWVGTWSSAPQAPTDIFAPTWSLDGFGNQTVREVIRISTGGSALRIRMSNVYGSAPLRLSGATIAETDAGAS